MFDEDCQSDQEEDFRMGYKSVVKTNPKALTPSEPNMTLSMKQGEELMKLMKERGIEMKDTEIKQMKQKQPETMKKQNKAGFYDGGHSAPLEELMAALNKAYGNNDPQQASCILSYILQNKSLTPQDRNKFGLMKCNLLFGLAAYEDCCDRATTLIQTPLNDVSYARLSNYLAKCKLELGRVWQGFMDLQRAKALILNYKDQKQKAQQPQLSQGNYVQTQLDSAIRDIGHTQMQYNIRIAKQKSTLNLVHPTSNIFRNRRIYSVSAGDYHGLFLVGAGEYDKEVEGRWGKEVFGVGENAAGQVTGNAEHKQMFNQPVLVKELSGKGVEGVFATRESSLAYDECGNIYEWGAKSNSKKNVELIASLTQKISKLQKGNNHYCALTQSGRLFLWGRLQYLQTPIFTSPKPTEQLLKNIVDFSCGVNYVMAIDKNGSLWAMGSNQYGQLGAPGEKFLKEFTKINVSRIGPLKKVYCVVECTFMESQEGELFFCGRHSFSKETIETPKQAEFTDQPKIICVTGQPGLYYITNQNGQAYVWEVDSSVKFKPDRTKDKFSQRIIEFSKINLYRVKTLPVPKLCFANVITKQLKTYQPISIEVSLRDQLGQYGLDLAQPVKYTVHLSRKLINKQQLIQQSQKFLKLTSSKYKQNKPYLDQIINSQLLTSVISQPPSPSTHHLQISIQRSGTYYLYLLMDSVIVNGQPLELNVSPSEKQQELQRQMQEEKERRRQERELAKLREEELRRQQEEEQQAEAERRKETEKRAEEAYKQHMREQEELRRRQEEDRRRRAELQTGGGFDLTKLRKKVSEDRQQQQPEPITAVTPIFDPKKRRASEQMQQSTQSRRKLDYENYSGEVPQLPDINARPSSKRKLVLKKASDGPDALKTTTSNMMKGTGPVKRGNSVKKG